MTSFIETPERTAKPRQSGLTSLLDNGLPVEYFSDVLRSYAPLVDFVKFGWCTSLVTPRLADKIAVCEQQGIDFYFGGTLFEKACLQGKLEDFAAFCRDSGCRYVEVSNGTIEMENSEKARHIERLGREFKVLSEVGYKDNRRSIHLHPSKWVAFIREDLAAGAVKVMTEARESGTSGICRDSGELRFGLIAEILESVAPDDLIFEAPTKRLQTWFVRELGPNVNLANVQFDDVVPVETLRQGLRSETLDMRSGRREEGAA